VEQHFDVGPLDKPQHVLNIQPVYPVSPNDDWNLITRTIMPLDSQPSFGQGQSRERRQVDNPTGYWHGASNKIRQTTC
jgi:hypothetical protein